MSSWKLPIVLKNFNKNLIFKKSFWEIFLEKNLNLRSLVIPSTLIGKRIYIYNGKIYKFIRISSKMVGHKFGEFAITKVLGKAIRKAGEKKRKKKKNNNKKKKKSRAKKWWICY